MDFNGTILPLTSTMFSLSCSNNKLVGAMFGLSLIKSNSDWYKSGVLTEKPFTN